MQRDILQKLTERVRPFSRTVVLSDSLDERTLRAAVTLRSMGAVKPLLIGPGEAIRSLAAREHIPMAGIGIEDPATSEHLPRLLEELATLRKGERKGRAMPEISLKDPLMFANMMVRCGLADGSVAGSVSKTSDVIRAAIRTIGLRPGVRRVSSYFLMVFQERVMVFTDCAVLPDPDAPELVEIAGLAADNYAMITGTAPVVAFLSFSTKGSAEHPDLLKVRAAAATFRLSRPDISSDGELQLDAAIDPAVAGLKAPGSQAAGRANVLIFPDLNSGNIGYKIAQRLGGADAFGPILQGLARPAFDLSRGCSDGDIVMVSVLNALSAA